MELSPQEIYDKQFHDEWRGYSQKEVDDFLDRVAEVIDRVQRENQSLHQRVRELEQTLSSSREAEEMLKKTLVTAQQAAEEAIGKAKNKAELLITEAEERSRKAHDETRDKLQQAESEIRRRSVDADREFADRKRQLDAEIQRLIAFEGELKARLRAYLEQQMRALETLSDKQPPVVRVPEARPQPRGPVDPATQQVPPQPTMPQAQTRPPERSDEDERPTNREPEAVAPQRRGVRGLFTRDEG